MSTSLSSSPVSSYPTYYHLEEFLPRLTWECAIALDPMTSTIYVVGGYNDYFDTLDTVVVMKPINDNDDDEKIDDTSSKADDDDGKNKAAQDAVAADNNNDDDDGAANPPLKFRSHEIKLPAAVEGAAAVVHNSKLYVIGGVARDEEGNTDVPTDRVQCYDIQKQEWLLDIASMNRPRSYGAVVVLPRHNKLLVVGGENDAAVSEESDEVLTTSCELFDCETNQWTMMASGNLKKFRKRFAAVSVRRPGGKTVVAVIGGLEGKDEEEGLASCEYIEFKDDDVDDAFQSAEWRYGARLMYPREGCAVVQIGPHHIVALGGGTPYDEELGESAGGHYIDEDRYYHTNVECVHVDHLCVENTTGGINEKQIDDDDWTYDDESPPIDGYWGVHCIYFRPDRMYFTALMIRGNVVAVGGKCHLDEYDNPEARSASMWDYNEGIDHGEQLLTNARATDLFSGQSIFSAWSLILSVFARQFSNRGRNQMNLTRLYVVLQHAHTMLLPQTTLATSGSGKKRRRDDGDVVADE